MSKDNKPITLTSFLNSATSTLGKLSFIFFIGMLVMAAFAVSDGKPSINEYTISPNAHTDLYKFSVSQASLVQVGFANSNSQVNSNTQLISYTYYLAKIQYLHNDTTLNKTSVISSKISPNDIQSNEIVFSFNGTQVFRELWLEAGSYQVSIESGSSAGTITAGSGNFNHGLVALTGIFAALFGMFFSFFVTILMAFIFVLIINAFIPNDNRRREADAERKLTQNVYVQQPVQQGPTQRPGRIENASTFNANRPPRERMLGSESWFDKLYRNDWLALSFGIFFFFASFTNPSGPFLFFAILLIGYTVYSVSERQKMIERINVLLHTYSRTNVEFLAKQLGKKSREVAEVIRLMILDQAFPIKYDVATGLVEVTGALPDFPGYQTPKNQQPISKATPAPTVVAPTVAAPVAPAAPQVQEPAPVAKPSVPEEPPAKDEPLTSIHCTACGSTLPVTAKYCYTCGVRQF